MSLYIFLHPLYSGGESVQFWWSNSLSLKGSQAATGFTATRGRRCLFLVLALLLFIRQKAGERLCSRDKSHCQPTSCGGKKVEKESMEHFFLARDDVYLVSFTWTLHPVFLDNIFMVPLLLSYCLCWYLYIRMKITRITLAFFIYVKLYFK